MPADFRQKVLDVVGSLRPGEVVSYGDVAAQAGYPGAGRGVGAVLASLKGLAGSKQPVGKGELPWWRVVYADGRLAPVQPAEQARRLALEGVRVRGLQVESRPANTDVWKAPPAATGPYAGPVPAGDGD